MITIGGSAVASPALARAIREFGEQAKKQLDATGSLAGFEAKFSDDSSSDGSVTITVSAMGAAAYGAQYGKDDTILAYTLTTEGPDFAGGTATSLSSGSSEIIHGDKDIDAFTARFQQSTEMIHFGAYISGTPEELAAAGLGPLPQPDDPDAGAAADDAKAPSDAQAKVFSKLQQKQSAADRLIDFLQSVLDGRAALHSDDARKDEKGDSAADAIGGRLARFTGTDIST